jgi:CheY-like chemotaxis protein
MPTPLLLLVDDAPEMGHLVRLLGRRAGCEVVVRLDAETSWAALAQRRPDLVLLDVNLPGVRGPEFLRRLRATPDFAALTVALYCHDGRAEDVAGGLDAGADFVFDKNLAAQPDAWLRRLHEILAWTHRRPLKSSLGWSMGEKRSAAEGLAVFNVAFRDAAFRAAAPEVFRSLLRRALVEALSPSVPIAALDSWIAADARGLDAIGLSSVLTPEAVGWLASGIIDQMERWRGAETAAACRAALEAADPQASDRRSER